MPSLIANLKNWLDQSTSHYNLAIGIGFGVFYLLLAWYLVTVHQPRKRSKLQLSITWMFITLIFWDTFWPQEFDGRLIWLYKFSFTLLVGLITLIIPSTKKVSPHASDRP